MKRNPIVPYILIMVLGLGIVFFLSIKGIGDSRNLQRKMKARAREKQKSSSQKHMPRNHVSDVMVEILKEQQDHRCMEQAFRQLILKRFL